MTRLKHPELLASSEELPIWMYPWLVQQMAEFRERSQLMPLAHREEFERKMEEFLQEHLASLPTEELHKALKGIPPEELLKAMATEQRQAIKKLLEESEEEV